MSRLRRRVGLGHRQIDVAAVAVGDEQLVAVEDVVVAVARGGGADCLRVRAGVRFGDRETALLLARRQTRQEAVFLLLGAVLVDDPAVDHVGVDDSGQAHPAARNLLDYGRVGLKRESQPAVRLGEGDPEDAHLAHVGMNLGGELARVLQLGCVGDDLFIDPAAHVARDLHAGLAVAGDDLPYIRHARHRSTSCQSVRSAQFTSSLSVGGFGAFGSDLSGFSETFSGAEKKKRGTDLQCFAGNCDRSTVVEFQVFSAFFRSFRPWAVVATLPFPHLSFSISANREGERQYRPTRRG